MLFFLVPCAPSHVIRVCFHDQTKNIRVSCLFVLFYDWYILLSVIMFSVFSTPSCIHALFHILNSLEAQISIYLLLTVGQKHLKTPLFCLQISIPDFRVSYFSLHCVADKPNRVSHFSAQIFPSALLMYLFFFFLTICAWTRSSGQLLPVVVRLSPANQNIIHSYQALLSTPILQ